MRIGKKKLQKYIAVCGMFLLFWMIFGCSLQNVDEKARENSWGKAEVQNSTHAEEEMNTQNDDKQNSSQLEVHFIDVGQGDATLLLCDGHAMLIDAGEDSKGTTVWAYLQKQGIEKLDYVIGAHPDADHIGGLDVILTKLDCDQILFPEASSDTTAYRNVMEAIEYKGYRITRPETGASYQLGGASVTLIGPVNMDEENQNNNSIGLKVTFGENSFIFIGDAEKEAQQDMLQIGIDLNADVLKVGHHGSGDSANLAFLQAVDPDYAVISCGTGNDYGHPHKSTLNLLKERGIEVFRTDEQGTIVAISDGTKIRFNCEPSLSWQSGVVKEAEIEVQNFSQEEDQEIQNADYILNTNSLKFHKPECESVADMSSKNKQGSNLLREEIIALGYTPCNRCKP